MRARHLRADRRELVDLTQGTKARDVAERADAQAFAAARLAGTKDPGAIHVAEFNAKAADLTRRRAGLAASVAATGSTYSSALREHAEVLEADAVARLKSAAEWIRSAVDELEAAVAEHADSTAFGEWLRVGPTRPVSKARPVVAVGGERVRVPVALAGFVELADIPTGFEPVAGERFFDPGDRASLPALAVPRPGRAKASTGDGPLPAA